MLGRRHRPVTPTLWGCRACLRAFDRELAATPQREATRTMVSKSSRAAAASRSARAGSRSAWRSARRLARRANVRVLRPVSQRLNWADVAIDTHAGSPGAPPWCAALQALACLLQRRGFNASPAGPGVEVLKGDHSTEDILDALIDAGIDEPPPLDDLLADAKNLQREKWDWALRDWLLRRSYASLHLNLDEALTWTRTLPNG
jgi:hypothetical protein